MTNCGKIIDNLRWKKLAELAHKFGEPAAGRRMSPNVRLMKTTEINIPTEIFVLLRAVAFNRAQGTGENPTVSTLITELAERHREELEKEAGL